MKRKRITIRDQICVTRNACMPFVIGPGQEEIFSKLIGEAYVDGRDKLAFFSLPRDEVDKKNNDFGGKSQGGWVHAVMAGG